MKKKTKATLKKNSANFFGAFGYLFCLLQWFWAVMLYFSVVQTTTKFVSPDMGSEPARQSPDIMLSLPDPLRWGILIAVTVAMIAISVYALIKVPMSIVKTSNKAVRRTAETIAPVVMNVQHQKDTKKSRRKVTVRLILAIKLLVVIVPVGLAVGSGLLEKQYIDYSIATIVGYGLAVASIGAFAVQYLLGRVLRVPVQELW